MLIASCWHSSRLAFAGQPSVHHRGPRGNLRVESGSQGFHKIWTVFTSCLGQVQPTLGAWRVAFEALPSSLFSLRNLIPASCPSWLYVLVFFSKAKLSSPARCELCLGCHWFRRTCWVLVFAVHVQSADSQHDENELLKYHQSSSLSCTNMSNQKVTCPTCTVYIAQSSFV